MSIRRAAMPSAGPVRRAGECLSAEACLAVGPWPPLGRIPPVPTIIAEAPLYAVAFAFLLLLAPAALPAQRYDPPPASGVRVASLTAWLGNAMGWFGLPDEGKRP